MPVNLVNSSLLVALVGVLPDEISEPSKEGDHQTYGPDTGENHYIDEHLSASFSCGVPCFDGSKVSPHREGEIDLDQ